MDDEILMHGLNCISLVQYSVIQLAFSPGNVSICCSFYQLCNLGIPFALDSNNDTGGLFTRCIMQ